MEILNNYLEYRKHKPEYKEWQAKRTEQAERKKQYLKENPISDIEKQKQLQKIKIVLDAVDTMDEFSQKKAENTEIATQVVQSTVSQGASYAGLGIGALFLFLMRNKLGTLEKTSPTKATMLVFSPMIFASIVPLITSLPLVNWTTKAEIFASKIGRHEAVKTQLNSENQFAILNDEQIKELNEKADSIKLENKENSIIKGFKEAFETTKNLFGQNKEVKEYLKNENEKFEAHKENFNKPISKKDIENAKEEQQMITQIVEEIDKASQDYAEDVEFGTNSFMAAATALGIGGTGLSAWILNKIKVKNQLVSKGVPVGIAILTTIGAGAIAAKIQKQSSRVARYKVMQNLQQNPEKLLYVDDTKIDTTTSVKPEEKKKENLIQFYLRLYNENKEYNKYIKENGERDKKLKLAKNQIKLTEKQKADAKQLQKNVFKTFNKIDDKSQTYSESTEALGEIVKTYGSMVSVLIGCGASIAATMSIVKKNSDKFFAPIIPIFASLIPVLALDAYVTKEQKNSSRVAHMLAIKDLDDYKHFVDYDNLKPEKEKAKEEQKPEIKQINNDIFSRFNFKK